MITKKTKKAVKSCGEIEVSVAEPFVEPFVEPDADFAEPCCDAEPCCEAKPTVDFGYVRDTVKGLVDYLAQFDNECAKTTVGNLAYIYLDLTNEIE